MPPYGYLITLGPLDNQSKGGGFGFGRNLRVETCAGLTAYFIGALPTEAILQSANHKLQSV
jgi:hypothetical protein